MELSIQTHHQSHSINWSIDKVICQERSWYQNIVIARTKNWGRMLLLDNRVVLTERDAELFQEYLAHIPLMLHPKPEHVMICGGAWGGIAQEAIKHASVKQVSQVELDDILVDNSVRFWPRTPVATEIRNTNLIVDDLPNVAQQRFGSQDVLIIDIPSMSSNLSSLQHYIIKSHGVLNPQGFLMLSLGSAYGNMENIHNLQATLNQLFERVFPVAFHMPSREGGINFCFFCSNWCSPVFNLEHQKKLQNIETQLSCYDAANHSACFVLPKQIGAAIPFQ